MSNKNLQNQNSGENIHPDIVKLFSKATEVALTPEEKLKGTLLFQEFIHENPLKNQVRSESSTRIKALNFFSHQKIVHAFAIAVLIFSMATSAVYAAQDSIPGELLYPVKTQINERIERALARSPEAKAKVTVKQTMTRLEEMKKLLERNKIDSKNQKAIYNGLVRNSEEVEKNIVKLKKEGHINNAIKIDSDFEKLIINSEKDINKLEHTFKNKADRGLGRKTKK